MMVNINRKMCDDMIAPQKMKLFLPLGFSPHNIQKNPMYSILGF